MAQHGLEDEIRNILDRQAAHGQAALGDSESAYLASQELEFEKWRLIHKHLHQHLFAVSERLARSAQWREAANRIRDLGEMELLDWTLQQAEIAGNLERGIQDLRPRRNGPCHALVLEYVANRKRKALAVLRFARAGEDAKAGEDGGVYKVNSAFHARTRDILGGDPAVEDGDGHEGVPWTEAEDEDGAET
jgi:hypothetical protein